jgi:hypothetical protein
LVLGLAFVDSQADAGGFDDEVAADGGDVSLFGSLMIPSTWPEVGLMTSNTTTGSGTRRLVPGLGAGDDRVGVADGVTDCGDARV